MKTELCPSLDSVVHPDTVAFGLLMYLGFPQQVQGGNSCYLHAERTERNAVTVINSPIPTVDNSDDTPAVIKPNKKRLKKDQAGRKVSEEIGLSGKF